MLRRLMPISSVAVLVASVARPALAVPTEPNQLVNPLQEALSCELCHTYSNAAPHAADPLYAPFVGWQGSMMANSARDPVFWAAVAIADQDDPGETTDCIRCHSPRAFLEGRGGATSIDQLMPADFGGVECELCHRMTDEGELGNAQYAVADVLGPGGTVPRHGPWTYGAGDPAPPHDWLADPFTGSSQLCGTCHDVTTPRERVDDAGTGLGVSFNEQRTYSEWAGSAFAQAGADFQSCQDCHMPAVADMPGCNMLVDVASHPTGGRRHDLVGANRFMVEAIASEYGAAAGGQIDDFYFDETVTRMDELLATAATIEVQAPPDVDLSAGLDGLSVTVTNNTGHKLPTGYSEGRVMWIEVVATYGGTEVWSSGQGIEALRDASDANLRTYQAVAEDYDTGVTLHLLRNNHWVEDTRIPPQGLTPNLETDPVGDRYALGMDGTWPNFDVADYAFAGVTDVFDQTPEATDDDTLEVSVRLVYLINTPQYVQFLADENTTNDAGNDVAALFDSLGGATPLELASAQLSIPIVGFPEPMAGTTTGVGTDSTGAPTTAGSTSATAADATGTGGTTGTQDDDGGGGCSCRTASPAGAGGWLLLLVLAPSGRRRRVA